MTSLPEDPLASDKSLGDILAGDSDKRSSYLKRMEAAQIDEQALAGMFGGGSDSHDEQETVAAVTDLLPEPELPVTAAEPAPTVSEPLDDPEPIVTPSAPEISEPELEPEAAMIEPSNDPVMSMLVQLKEMLERMNGRVEHLEQLEHERAREPMLVAAAETISVADAELAGQVAAEAERAESVHQELLSAAAAAHRVRALASELAEEAALAQQRAEEARKQAEEAARLADERQRAQVEVEAQAIAAEEQVEELAEQAGISAFRVYEELAVTEEDEVLTDEPLLFAEEPLLQPAIEPEIEVEEETASDGAELDSLAASLAEEQAEEIRLDKELTASVSAPEAPVEPAPMLAPTVEIIAETVKISPQPSHETVAEPAQRPVEAEAAVWDELDLEPQPEAQRTVEAEENTHWSELELEPTSEVPAQVEPSAPELSEESWPEFAAESLSEPVVGQVIPADADGQESAWPSFDEEDADFEELITRMEAGESGMPAQTETRNEEADEFAFDDDVALPEPAAGNAGPTDEWAPPADEDDDLPHLPGERLAFDAEELYERPQPAEQPLPAWAREEEAEVPAQPAWSEEPAEGMFDEEPPPAPGWAPLDEEIAEAPAPAGGGWDDALEMEIPEIPAPVGGDWALPSEPEPVSSSIDWEMPEDEEFPLTPEEVSAESHEDWREPQEEGELAVQPPVAAAVPPASSDLMLSEPKDILWAVASIDPSKVEANAALKSITDLRPTKKGGSSKKLRFEMMPFDQLVEGHPLIITCFSPSGGVGKSSTAMNIAGYLAAVGEEWARQQAQKGNTVRVPRILIIDGDLVHGSLALRLTGQLRPSLWTLLEYYDERGTWPTVYEGAREPEKAMKDFVMWPEFMPNLNLLATPEDPDNYFDVLIEDYPGLFRMLSQFYDIIIVDSGTEVVMDSQRAWLSNAHAVLLITSPEVDRIYNAKKAARYISQSRPHPKDKSENPQVLPALVAGERIAAILTRADLKILGDPEVLMDHAFPFLDDKQRFMIPDVSQQMMAANNNTEANSTDQFLVFDHSEYNRVIGQMLKFAFSRYRIDGKR